MTTPKTYHVSSCIFLLSCFILCRSHTNPFDFLKALNGTQKGDMVKGLAQLKKHLANLGYIDQTNPTTYSSTNTNDDDTFDDTLEQAIRKYQDFYKINVTGILDSQTVTSMLQPRCGVPDILNGSPTSFGSSKYVLTKYKWPRDKRNLTVSFPTTRRDAYASVKRALDSWAKVSPFKFIFTTDNRSDVKISFRKRDHGDGFPFDGRLRVLAHAFLPTDGRLHFDDEENWTTHKHRGDIDLQTVALHELGHVLGLNHSMDKNAVMYAQINEHVRKDLTLDDVQGINDMYK